jgi:hypothetical protein
VAFSWKNTQLQNLWKNTLIIRLKILQKIFFKTLALSVQCPYIYSMKKEERLEIRTTPETKKKLQKLAEQSKRTPSHYLHLLIEHAHKNKIIL